MPRTLAAAEWEAHYRSLEADGFAIVHDYYGGAELAALAAAQARVMPRWTKVKRDLEVGAPEPPLGAAWERGTRYPHTQLNREGRWMRVGFPCSEQSLNRAAVELAVVLAHSVARRASLPPARPLAFRTDAGWMCVQAGSGQPTCTSAPAQPSSALATPAMSATGTPPTDGDRAPVQPAGGGAALTGLLGCRQAL